MKVKFDQVTGERVEVTEEEEVEKLICVVCGTTEEVSQNSSKGVVCWKCFLHILTKEE